MKNGCGNIPHQKSLKTQRLSTEKTAMSALGCQKLGRGQGRFFPRAFRGFLAFPIPWFWLVNLPNCEKIHFHYFRHPVCGTLLWQLEEALTPLFCDWGHWHQTKFMLELSADPFRFCFWPCPLSWFTPTISKCLLYIVTWMMNRQHRLKFIGQKWSWFLSFPRHSPSHHETCISFHWIF